MTINKRILTSALTIGTAGALLVGATFAFFSDSVTSNGNTFSTGILELKIMDNNEGFSDAVTASTVASNMTPGGAVTESFICFKNTGDYPIEEILLNMSASGNIAALAPYVKVTKIELKAVSSGDCENFAAGGFTGTENVDQFNSLFAIRFDGEGGQPTGDGVSLYEALSDINGTDRDEDDLLDGPAVLPADPSVLLKFRTTWQLDVSAPNSAQGKSVTVDTTYVGNQLEN